MGKTDSDHATVEQKLEATEKLLASAVEFNEQLHHENDTLTEQLRVAKLHWWQSKKPRTQDDSFDLD